MSGGKSPARVPEGDEWRRIVRRRAGRRSTAGNRRPASREAINGGKSSAAASARSLANRRTSFGAPGGRWRNAEVRFFAPIGRWLFANRRSGGPAGWWRNARDRFAAPIGRWRFATKAGSNRRRRPKESGGDGSGRRHARAVGCRLRAYQDRGSRPQDVVQAAGGVGLERQCQQRRPHRRTAAAHRPAVGHPRRPGGESANRAR